MIEHNGKEYARVTEILQPFNDFSMIDPEVLEHKKNIGTSVHKAIDDFSMGEFPILAADEVGYFNSYLKWAEYVKPVYIVREKRYFDDDLMITGQVDGLVRLEGSQEIIVLDYKTSATESPIVWPMQGHMYHYMASKECNISNRIIFLKLDKKGGIPIAYTYKYDQNMMNKCKIAIDKFYELRKNASH